MKLSEIKGDRAIEVIADLIEPTTNIALDKNVAGIFKVVPLPGEDARAAAARSIKKNVPRLLKTHKADIIAILSTLEGKAGGELGLPRIIAGLIELLGDREFLELFGSAASTGGPMPQSEEPKASDA